MLVQVFKGLAEGKSQMHFLVVICLGAGIQALHGFDFVTVIIKAQDMR